MGGHPCLHWMQAAKDVDGRDKRGHDTWTGSAMTHEARQARPCIWGACVSLFAAWYQPASAGAMMMRRFCLPLFSIFTTVIRPISPVRATCVPPQG